MKTASQLAAERLVRIRVGGVTLDGNLGLVEGAQGIVLFAHGSGSSRYSPRNTYVARVLRQAGVGTLLMDLLSQEEEILDMQTARLRFDMALLTTRVIAATDWLARNSEAANLAIGYFGASTGAGAALAAAADRPDRVGAVVSRGGRPDLAGAALPRVKAPTLLIVGERDYQVIAINREAMAKLQAEKELAIVPRATHLFEEPGALEQVARLAADWFTRYLVSQATEKPAGVAVAA